MIRPYKETDLDNLISIWRESFIIAHPFMTMEFIDQVEADIRDVFIPQAKTWVFIETGRFIGFVSMLGNEVGGLFIKPECHKNGIGTKLLNYVIRSHNELEVEVFKDNLIGKAFYKKYGFVIMKEYKHAPTNRIVQRLLYKSQ